MTQSTEYLLYRQTILAEMHCYTKTGFPHKLEVKEISDER